MTLTHKEEALWRWTRHCDAQKNLPYGYRKIRAASEMDWGRIPSTLSVLVEAGYCLDSIVKEPA
jgi:hypothetical protein